MTYAPAFLSSAPLRGISSMATRRAWQALAAQWQALSGRSVEWTFVGGVEAARRVQSGECWDVVFLAADALARLEASGHLRAGSIQPLARSGVAAAVAAGQGVQGVLQNAEDVRQRMLQAPSIAYSTGPSGQVLMQWVERWGLREALSPQLIQAPPGVPVGSLVASGQAALGFQQLSELLHEPGIKVLGLLPAEMEMETIFAGAIGHQTVQPAAAQALLDFLASPAAQAAKAVEGLLPVADRD